MNFLVVTSQDSGDSFTNTKDPIVDNLFKPAKSIASAVLKKFAKPLAKKALEARISHYGERLGKKISEKSGDLIMKKLGNAQG